jgi:hypothetical protein
MQIKPLATGRIAAPCSGPRRAVHPQPTLLVPPRVRSQRPANPRSHRPAVAALLAPAGARGDDVSADEPNGFGAGFLGPTARFVDPEQLPRGCDPTLHEDCDATWSPNRTGLIADAAHLARFVYAGYGRSNHGPISIARGRLYGPDHPLGIGVCLVGLSGLEFVEGQATGIRSAFNAAHGFDSRFAFAAREALKNYSSGADILVLAGHSLGGMVGQQLAGDATIQRQYRHIYCITYGSPPVGPPTYPAHVHVRRLVDPRDVVPKLSVRAVWSAFGNGKVDASVECWKPDANFVAAHTHSYCCRRTWGHYDALGRAGGSARIEFDPESRLFVEALFRP